MRTAAVVSMLIVVFTAAPVTGQVQQPSRGVAVGAGVSRGIFGLEPEMLIAPRFGRVSVPLTVQGDGSPLTWLIGGRMHFNSGGPGSPYVGVSAGQYRSGRFQEGVASLDAGIAFDLGSRRLRPVIFGRGERHFARGESTGTFLVGGVGLTYDIF